MHRIATRGWIPLLHGDVVTDTHQGVAILSGDTIIHELCRHIPSLKRAVFLTDVDGVFDHDPAEPGARRIAEVRVRGLEDFVCMLEGVCRRGGGALSAECAQVGYLGV